MGKLIDPELGDYIDRYTILQLKLQHDRLSTSTVVESGGIQRAVPWIDMRIDLVVKIAIVNTLLWVATEGFDAVTDSQGSETHIAGLAMKMRRLNRQRADLVAELSGLDEAAKEEVE